MSKFVDVFSQRWWKKYSSDCFVVIFFSFYFLNALQSDNNSNRVYVLGHKYVLGPSQTHFSPRLAARAKMSLSRAQNIFMPANINSIVILARYPNKMVSIWHIFVERRILGFTVFLVSIQIFIWFCKKKNKSSWAYCLYLESMSCLRGSENINLVPSSFSRESPWFTFCSWTWKITNITYTWAVRYHSCACLNSISTTQINIQG